MASNIVLSILLYSPKVLHIIPHKLKMTIRSIRYKCSQYSKIFIGEYSTFYHRCKGKLGSEIIEIEDVKKGNEDYLVDKKVTKEYAQ